MEGVCTGCAKQKSIITLTIKIIIIVFETQTQTDMSKSATDTYNRFFLDASLPFFKSKLSVITL